MKTDFDEPRHAIVVDASVGRSCGDETAIDAHAVACRDVLAAIRRARMRLVMSPQIMVEWIEHRSRHAVKWLGEMTDRRLVDAVNPPEHGATRAAIEALKEEGIRVLLTKDLLLVEAALASDQRVVSGDNQARRHFHELCGIVGALGEVHWSDPDDSRCLGWLNEGALEDERLKLRSA